MIETKSLLWSWWRRKLCFEFDTVWTSTWEMRAALELERLYRRETLYCPATRQRGLTKLRKLVKIVV